MATQTVEFLAVYGQTLTAKLYAVGSDTLVQTASAVTEQTNRVGVYRATFTDAAAGEYELHVATSGGIPVARWYVTLTLTTATFQAYDTAVRSVTAGVTVTTNNDKTGYTLSQSFPANFATLGINSSGHVSRVTLVDTTTTNTDMRGTDGAALASAWTATRAGYMDSVLLAVNSNRTVQVTGSHHVAADIHELQTAVITADKFAANWLTAAGTAADYITELQTAIGTATNQTAIKVVTDRINTGLVADGAVWQFTVNMLELAPAGGGGGSATLENQELILSNLDDITGAVSAAVARLQLETQITGFPATICRGSDYDTTLESEIRLQLLDLNNAPITEIGGTPVDEITWLFGLGTDRQPRLVEGACSWDGTTDELVIELAAADTNTTPLGSVTWQIGAQIGELVRWLASGTTRIVERQFTT